jgi:hypothetical protein
MKKIGFIVSVYNKIDDLAAHLEIFKYCPFDHEVIVVYMMDLPSEYQKLVDQFHAVRIEGVGHYIGPLLSAVAGVRKANELGLDYVVYRNADDWLFNYGWEKQNFDTMAKKPYICGGYNWMNVGSNQDVTLNQVYFDVPKFMTTADDAEKYFLRSSRGFLCEFKMARWVRKTCQDMNVDFYRLKGREQYPGIGWESKDIVKAYGQQVPIGFWEKLNKNNRYFNEEWQLIGSHDNASRLEYWKRIRKSVPYFQELEKEHHFARFLETAKVNEKWNVTVKSEPLATSAKKPSIFKRKIF